MRQRRHFPDWVEEALQRAFDAIDNALQEAEDEGLLGPARKAIYEHLRTNWGGGSEVVGEE